MAQPQDPQQNQPASHPQQPIPDHDTSAGLGPRMSKRKTKVWLALVILLFAGLIAAAGALLWYQNNTAPLDPDANARVFTVEQGESASGISDRLEQEEFIRSSLAFKISLRLEDAATTIKPGPYRLSPAQSAQEIITELQEGVIEVANFTIIPGESLFDVEEKLARLGYSQASIDEAMNQDYDHPALRLKPQEASLEGYLYPDTYEVALNQPPSAVIIKALDHFHRTIGEQDLYRAFEDKELTFHEAVIMASIVEREVNTDKDRPIVAQVFLERLKIGMMLGADSTFVYAAEKDGKKPQIEYPSPYNTRINTGLPPGPISGFTVDALAAVANPADTSYLFFVTGDDNVTHYAETEQGHQENVENYCGVRCEL